MIYLWSDGDLLGNHSCSSFWTHLFSLKLSVRAKQAFVFSSVPFPATASPMRLSCVINIRLSSDCPIRVISINVRMAMERALWFGVRIATICPLPSFIHWAACSVPADEKEYQTNGVFFIFLSAHQCKTPFKLLIIYKTSKVPRKKNEEETQIALPVWNGRAVHQHNHTKYCTVQMHMIHSMDKSNDNYYDFDEEFCSFYPLVW